MPLYDFHCNGCGEDREVFKMIADRHEPIPCPKCNNTMEKVFRPTPRYMVFQPYFDEGLGEFITGRDHRRRVMKTLGMDFKDHMSKGDQSARKDWAADRRRERARR